jgi:hypothetical protein
LCHGCVSVVAGFGLKGSSLRKGRMPPLNGRFGLPLIGVSDNVA